MKKRLFSLMLAVFLCCAALPVSADTGSGEVLPVGYNVSVNASDDNFGTVTGAGVYTFYASVTVTATPSDIRFVFLGWYENEKLVSTSASYTFFIEEDRCFTASFSPYVAILDPGELGDLGSDVLYYDSQNQSNINLYNEAAECEFFYDTQSGGLSFKLSNNYCPEQFIEFGESAYLRFDYWIAVPTNKAVTVYTYYWTFDVALLPDSSFELSPESITLDGAGFNDVSLTTDELKYGKYLTSDNTYEIAYCLKLYVSGEELRDENDNVIKYRFADSDHAFFNNVIIDLVFHKEKETKTFAVFIDPDDYKNAAPGLYTGELYILYVWYDIEENIYIKNNKKTIAISLTVPENDDGPFTVRFISDGTVISEQTVESGNAAQAPEVSDTPYGFFTGWDKAFDSVTEDTDINALFRYYGDVGNDGEADSSDAALILKFDAAMIDLTGDDLLCADADGNGEADSSDASLVLKYDSGSINGFRQ